MTSYVPWFTAERWIAEAGSQGLSPYAVLHLGTRLCEALASAHASGVLHLDVKPSNIFVDPAGDQAKLADFGIARTVASTRAEALVTRLVGTPAYMAPEQTNRGSKVGPWTDVYLLAGTLCELITGHKPAERIGQRGEPAGAAALTVLERGLSAAVDDRPKDAKMFGSLLAATLNEQMST
jgi:serine/threonine-protein kinase